MTNDSSRRSAIDPSGRPVVAAFRDALVDGLAAPKLLVASFVSVVVCGVFAAVAVPLFFLPFLGFPIALLVRGVIVPGAVAGLVSMSAASLVPARLDCDTPDTVPETDGFRAYLGGARRNLKAIGSAALVRVALDVALVTTIVGAVYFLVLFLAASRSSANPITTEAAMSGIEIGLVGVGVAYALGIVCFQFVDVAVLLGGADTTDAFRTSLGITRQYPRSVAVYSGIRLALLVGCGWLLLEAVSPLLTPSLTSAGLDRQAVATGGVVIALGVTALTALLTTFHVSYFLRIYPSASHES